MSGHGTRGHETEANMVTLIDSTLTDGGLVMQAHLCLCVAQGTDCFTAHCTISCLPPHILSAEERLVTFLYRQREEAWIFRVRVRK